MDPNTLTPSSRLGSFSVEARYYVSVHKHKERKHNYIRLVSKFVIISRILEMRLASDYFIMCKMQDVHGKFNPELPWQNNIHKKKTVCTRKLALNLRES